MAKAERNFEVLDSIARRAHYLATQMIYQANHRDDKEKGDPKVGGHVSASASALHLLGALHLVVRQGYDMIANKPHASPTDHAYNYLLDLFLTQDGQKLSYEQSTLAMNHLRKFSQNGEPVFQSYHSALDPDGYQFFPSGTVGIPPVSAGYLALAYRFAREHNYEVPPAHFWAITGDSEFREGSMYEAIPDFAEREIGNLTWIVDYNRQSLDGHRITNKTIMNGTDAVRIERTMVANGWEVIQLRHGRKRKALFNKPDGKLFQKFLEEELEDFEFQALLLVNDFKALKKGMAKEHPQLKKFLEGISEIELMEGLKDLGGHDFEGIVEALEASKKSTRRPTIIIAHTLKGWGLKMAAAPGNHSALVNEDEMESLRAKQGLSGNTLFARFEDGTTEGQFLKKRGQELLQQHQEVVELKNKNRKYFENLVETRGGIPVSFDINTKMASYPHTQWMLGQLTAKLTRIANTPIEGSAATADKAGKALSDSEKSWKLPGELFVSMAPDVGTSTNLNPAMDGKIFGAPVVVDYEADLGVKDTKLPDLVPGEEVSDRFLRFEIAEGNVMSCVGSFGKIRDLTGVPLIPLMTVYDFFIKRALDQYFYNLYWKSNFILVGTPSGVTLSPEGAQHGWKSDIQIPNQITWEPFFCQELDWIVADSIRRHLTYQNDGRNGVLIRGVTRGVEQRDLLTFLKRQARFKIGLTSKLCRAEFPMEGAAVESDLSTQAEAEIFTILREEVLQGGYYLIDYRGYAGYEPGDNVVQIFSMGSPTTEAIKASEALLARGIYANVIVVTSSDLMCGIQAHQNDYEYMKKYLGVTNSLFLNQTRTEVQSGPELATLSGRRVPIVSVHDGEAGLLDNLGSIIGVKQESLAVRKHSKVGRPKDIYAYHHIDAESIVEACGKALAETALEEVVVSSSLLQTTSESKTSATDWRDLWPTKTQAQH